MSDAEYISALRMLNDALLTTIDMERKRGTCLEKKHSAIKDLLQRPGNQLDPETTKELRDIVMEIKE